MPSSVVRDDFLMAPLDAEGKKAWEVALSRYFETVDVNEILEHVGHSGRHFRRFVALTDVENVQKSMETTKNPAGDVLPLDLVLQLREFWKGLRAADDETEVGNLPIMESMVLEAATESRARGDNADEMRRKLSKAIATGLDLAPDVEAKSSYGKALLELNPSSSKLGDVAVGMRYKGMGQVQRDVDEDGHGGTVEQATAYWMAAKHLIDRIGWRKFCRRMQRACKRHGRYGLMLRIDEFNCFLDSVEH